MKKGIALILALILLLTGVCPAQALEPPAYHTAYSVDELLQWIRTPKDEQPEDWENWSAFLRAANDAGQLPIVEAKSKEDDLTQILVYAGQTTMQYFFQNDAEEVFLVLLALPDEGEAYEGLDPYMAGVNAAMAETYEALQYTKTTGTVNGKEVDVWICDGGKYVRKDTEKLETTAPTAYFEWMGRPAMVRGIGTQDGRKWDPADLERFRFGSVELNPDTGAQTVMDQALTVYLQDKPGDTVARVWIFRKSLTQQERDQLYLDRLGTTEPPVEQSRPLLREYYTSYNQAFLDTWLPDLKKEDIHYLGKYTSAMIADLTKAQILRILDCEEIESIGLDPEFDPNFIPGQPDIPNLPDISHQAEIKQAYCDYLDAGSPSCNHRYAKNVIFEAYYGAYDGFELMELEYYGTPRPLDVSACYFLRTFCIPVYASLVVYHDGKIDGAASLYEDGALPLIDVMHMYCGGKSRAGSFEDVASEAWYADPVLWAYCADVTKGVDQTHFGPDRVCSRAQAVTLLYRAWQASWNRGGLELPTDPDTGFTDVRKGDYFYDPVRWAVRNGIVKGVSATRFAPNEPVTREQIVTMLWRMVGCPEPTGEGALFADTAGRYSETAVRWAAGLEIAQGVGENRFAPAGLCNRAQIVTFLYRERTQSQKPRAVYD